MQKPNGWPVQAALDSGSSSLVQTLVGVAVLRSWARYFAEHSASLHPGQSINWYQQIIRAT